MKFIALFLIIIITSCNDFDNNLKSDNNIINSSTVTNNLDTITPWEIEVKNFKYSIDNLYGFWIHADEPEATEPVFEIDKDGFHLLKGPSKQYIIDYDSIKISENHHESYSFGQITKLTQDSLIIEWSTNDTNLFLRFK